METVQVRLGARSYDILIGEGLIAGAAAHIAPLLPRNVTAIVTDETVARLHLEPLLASLSAAGIAASPVIVPDGEKAKNFSALERLVESLLDMKLERGDTILALGGGAVGDIAGFAAAIARRGMDFIQIPTTLLAQVDSAIGGKTGINTAQGKNLAGVFHQPRLVLSDTGVLSTLPGRALRAGYAEILKYGLIGDPAFFAWCETHGPGLLSGDTAARRYAVKAACAMKAEIVERDETETGERALLNFGHTFAHALEAHFGPNETLTHGEAVACGMGLAFDLSVRMGLCFYEEAGRVKAHLRAAGLPAALADLPGSVDRLALLSRMAQDKKVKNGKSSFILARGIGQAFIARDVPLDLAAATLDASSG